MAASATNPNVMGAALFEAAERGDTDETVRLLDAGALVARRDVVSFLRRARTGTAGSCRAEGWGWGFWDRFCCHVGSGAAGEGTAVVEGREAQLASATGALQTGSHLGGPRGSPGGQPDGVADLSRLGAAALARTTAGPSCQQQNDDFVAPRDDRMRRSGGGQR